MVAFVHLLAVAGPVFIIASLAMPAGIGGQWEVPKDYLLVPLKGSLNQSNIGTGILDAIRSILLCCTLVAHC